MKNEGRMDSISDLGGRAIRHIKRGPQMSMGKQEAFESFVRDHEDHLTIEDNKNILKQRSTEARRLGEQLNEARSRITELKKQLEMRRRQRAAHGVTENHAEEAEELDPLEENLCKHIEQEKVAYKKTIGRLKGLRTEIEHLQLLLERAKVKLQKDFQKWWTQEASSLQESESRATHRGHTGSPSGTSQPSSPGAPEICASGLSSTLRTSPSDQDPNTDALLSSAQDLRRVTPRSIPPVAAVAAWQNMDVTVTDSTSSSEWRPLSTTTISSSSIPLTGDQQADADILAFVRARQNLLSRIGPPQ